jgi:hypothetical protein
VIELDITTEAYEAHSIEQQERKEKYLHLFERDMSTKIERWNELSDRLEKKQEIAREDIAFMLHEIAFMFDSSVSEAVSYLHGHIKRLKENHVDSNGIELFVEVVSHYFEGIAFIMEKELSVFGRKKVIDSCIDKAKEVLKDTEEKAHELDLFLQGELDYMETWEKDRRKWEIFDHQLIIQRPYLPRDIEWIVEYSRISIENQVETGKLYFAHHFDRVEKEEFYRKRMESFSKVYNHYRKALETVATEAIPMLDTGGHLEHMKNHLREAKQVCASEHHEVKRHLQEAKQKEE